MLGSSNSAEVRSQLLFPPGAKFCATAYSDFRECLGLWNSFFHHTKNPAHASPTPLNGLITKAPGMAAQYVRLQVLRCSGTHTVTPGRPSVANESMVMMGYEFCHSRQLEHGYACERYSLSGQATRPPTPRKRGLLQGQGHPWQPACLLLRQQRHLHKRLRLVAHH